jgi:two-component system sensor histidine kinase SenX3
MDVITWLLLFAVVGLGCVATLWRIRWLRSEEELSEAGVAAATALGREPASVAEGVASLDQLRAEAERRADLIESAVEGSTDGVLVLGPRLDVVFAAGRAQRIVDGGHGFAEASLRLRELSREVAASGRTVSARIESAGEHPRAYHVVGAPLPSEAGQGAVIHLTDITDQERIDAIRRDFVANVSHELKTPVGALSVLAEALAESDGEEDRRRLGARLEDESRRLAALVDDILDLSLVESEKPSLVEVDLCEVIAEVRARVGVVAESAAMEVVVDAPGDSVVVEGDKRQLVSAVANLVDNAIKYSSFRTETGGRVWVRVKREGDHAVLEVEDHGIGISERHRGRIFERFYRVDRSRSRARGGTGLGLAIVRHVALNHGGSVEVESTPGVGSTFRLRIPVERAR